MAVRIALLLPGAPLPSIARTLAPATAAAAGLGSTVIPSPRRRTIPRTAPETTPRFHDVDIVERRAGPPVLPVVARSTSTTPPAVQDDGAPAIRPAPSPFAPPTKAATASRLGGSIWLLARGGTGGTVTGGQLGASQAGMRITYALGPSRSVALAARIAAPLRGVGREAALGIEWQPTRLPVRLVAEQRFALDGGRGGATIGVIGGYGPAEIARGVRLEAYGQAGGIHRSGIEGFVDASARVTHPVARIAGARLDLGIGAWGSAQRDVYRFDIGPSIALTMPVVRKAIRLTLDWRERVAGQARPGSGPALSIGSDF